MQIFGFTIIRTDDLKDLSKKYDEEYNARVNAERKLRTANANLDLAKKYIYAREIIAKFLREHSRPVNPINGRMMKEADWKKLETAATEEATKKTGLTRGELVDISIKFKYQIGVDAYPIYA